MIAISNHDSAAPVEGCRARGMTLVIAGGIGLVQLGHHLVGQYHDSAFTVHPAVNVPLILYTIVWNSNVLNS